MFNHFFGTKLNLTYTGDEMNTFNNSCQRLAWMFVLAALTVYTSSAQAHLKWFVDDSQAAYVYNNLVTYSLIWVGIGVALILIGIFIDKKFPQVSIPWQPKHIEKYATSILSMFLGASLIISALSGNLFSMNITDVGTLHITLLLLEGFIGLSLVFGLAVRQASVLLMGLWLLTMQTAGLIVTLENLWILGAAMFFLLRGRPVLRYSREDIFLSPDDGVNQAQALTFLRVFIGANLIFLGFSEKIMVPELGIAFLQEHQWNFMASMGLLWFTDELFIFSAGAVEIILGVFLMAGLAVRLTAAVLAVLFLTPPIFMGPAEMIGHIPHISIVVMLLLFGRGSTFGIDFTALSEMLRKANTQLQTPSGDTLRSHRRSSIRRSSIHNFLTALYRSGVYTKADSTTASSGINETLSPYPNHAANTRYTRTVNIRQNYGIDHKTNTVKGRHYGISRLARSRYTPLRGHRIQLMTNTRSA